MLPNIAVSDKIDTHIVRAALIMYADATISRVSLATGPVSAEELVSMVEVSSRVCALLETLNSDIQASIPSISRKEVIRNG